MPPPLKTNVAPHEGAAPTDRLASLAALSLVVGGASGLLGALFRRALEAADGQRDLIAAWAQEHGISGLIALVVLGAAATALAAWLVRRFSPEASGSGIPHVEAVLNRRVPQAPLRLIPVKFVGGWLAIGAGLALGREGPTVQMGASVAHFIGRLSKRNADDCLTLLAAGAGAGLATAFNAPIAGAVFVIEELLRRFETRSSIATLGASASAIAVSRVILGQGPDFVVAESPYPGAGALPFYLVLGLITGLLGVAYNRAILGALAVGGRVVKRVPIELQAAAIGAAVGALAWRAPDWVGGGEALTEQTLTELAPVATVLAMLVVRFVLGPVSYAARTPGGLFAPMLAVGTQIGVIYGAVVGGWFPTIESSPAAAGVVGMAAFFTAVVRAPMTGIVLVIEMTGSFTLLLPMLSACFGAMLVPTLMGEPPIYDSLAESKSEKK
ncbi:MAG: H(+)/Cl(-) exchange transporter ClcA [Planctomycetaceae bacterium]|uniref:H(+)/Cl(-) exchange transporter ClcA n=1 Tax=Lacipirellula limnantheis TaxID=2528024 RepID=A0A517U4A4_9BACT|nr:H(+)/Cl(-) exchange transporter ClcA [Lacipirellula limnantheis]MBL9162102.1 H(+)/Cl(-) exchange transporter ClcA [Planctomycetaceae bacterium]QDT75459.1 H(+)/Cl(-) exchange transporter ClcA [Lacipirellula limnantheis]